MEPVKISEGIYWVGAIDPGIRDFHGYFTGAGTTYNAYLIVDEKVTLIDTVKSNFMPEMMSRISKIMDPTKIDQIVCNHAEMDHSGALPQVVKAIGHNVPVYCSTVGAKIMEAHFHDSGINYKPVANGSSLSLGRRTLTFLETRMLHWPDSMFSFCPEEGILFSNDAFGMHLATYKRFDDQISEDIWYYQAVTYMANILTPYSNLITKLLETVTEMGLVPQIKMICPDHGIIWRQDPMRIVNLYAKWAKQEPTRRAVVLFDTMWGSTKAMAHSLADALSQYDVGVRLMPLKHCHRSEIITACFESGAILVGSPTLNNNLYPSIADFMCYLKGLKLQNKVAGAFGSHGWSGEATKMLHAELEAMKYNLPVPPVRYNWVPKGDAAFAPLKDMAKAIADNLPK